MKLGWESPKLDRGPNHMNLTVQIDTKNGTSLQHLLSRIAHAVESLVIC